MERNNHGHAIILSLVDVYGIPRMSEDMSYGLYLHDANYFGDKNKQALPIDIHKRMIGWDTNLRTKVLAASQLNTYIKDGSVIINSELTLSEMAAFVVKKAGKMGASGKNHDDTVTSAAIAAAILSIKPTGYNISPVYVSNVNPYTPDVSKYALPTVTNSIRIPNSI